MSKGKELLVHCCCGPCSTSSIERLLNEGYEPVLYFTNSNIDTKEEFEKRYENLLIVAKHFNLKVYSDVYEHEKWLEAIKGFEGEKEHGRRCTLCFNFSLNRAFEKAKELKIEHFCTTLTVSRFKNSKVIFSVGEKFEGFVPLDFKKQNGFARSIEIAKDLNLYRQQYCGCEFSKTN